MSVRGSVEWETTSQEYSEAQVEAVLNECNIDIVGDTSVVFTALCPFHGNTDTYAFAINKTSGKYICFNPSCGASGDLVELVRKTTKLSPFASQRLIIRQRDGNGKSFNERFAEIIEDKPQFVRFPQEPLDRMAQDLWTTPHALEYMRSRGFEDETLRYFGVGYSNAVDLKTKKPKNMIVVPMHDPTGMPVGLIGRSASHDEKEFKNSSKLPRKQTMFNLHRARRTGDTVVVVEANFDCMRVHQAGYPNVVALLGGSLSPWHVAQFNKYFTTIIIMTDDDELSKKHCIRNCPPGCVGHRPGRDLGRAIATTLKGKSIRWACYSDESIYENGAKDAGEMSDDGIRQSLKGAVNTFVYNQLTLAS